MIISLYSGVGWGCDVVGSCQSLDTTSFSSAAGNRQYIRPGLRELWFRVFWNCGKCSFILGRESLSQLGFVSQKTTNPFNGRMVRVWPTVFVVFFTYVPRCVCGLKIFWSIIDQERDWSYEKYENSEITAVRWKSSWCLQSVMELCFTLNVVSCIIVSQLYNGNFIVFSNQATCKHFQNSTLFIVWITDTVISCCWSIITAVMQLCLHLLKLFNYLQLGHKVFMKIVISAADSYTLLCFSDLSANPNPPHST